MDIARQVDHDEEDFKNLDREIWKKNQDYRNRYNLIDRPSDSCDVCKIDKHLWF